MAVDIVVIVAIGIRAELLAQSLAAGIVLAAGAVAVAAPVAEAAGDTGELVIIGEDRPTLANGDVVGGVEAERAEVDVDEDGRGAELDGRVDGGRETGGNGDDFIASLEAPISTMDFGLRSVSLEWRAPRPPARMTAFMRCRNLLEKQVTLQAGRHRSLLSNSLRAH